MSTGIEPTAEEFFVSATGVCVYVNICGRAVRVQFESPDGPGVAAQGMMAGDADEALAAATSVLERCKSQLRPLFERAARESAARR